MNLLRHFISASTMLLRHRKVPEHNLTLGFGDLYRSITATIFQLRLAKTARRSAYVVIRVVVSIDDYVGSESPFLVVL